jgi:hypothetical protein
MTTKKPEIRIIKRSEKAASEKPQENTEKSAKTAGDSAREIANTVASWVKEFKRVKGQGPKLGGRLVDGKKFA